MYLSVIYCSHLFMFMLILFSMINAHTPLHVCVTVIGFG